MVFFKENKCADEVCISKNYDCSSDQGLRNIGQNENLTFFVFFF